jgi:hypothetical protein
VTVAGTTITVIHNFNVLTAEQFVAFWNANGGSTYFTASFGSLPNTIIDDDIPGGTEIGTFEAEDEFNSFSGDDGLGGTTVTITLTYSRTVKDPSRFDFGLFTGTAVSDVLVFAPFDTAEMKAGSDLVVELVYFTEDSSEVAIAGTHALRTAPGAVKLKASPYSSDKEAVTSPSQQVVLTAAS